MHYLLSLFLLVSLADEPQYLSVEVSSSTAGGKMYVAAYNSQAGFKNEDFIANASAALGAQAAYTELGMQLPAAGEYVIAAFQDLNGNGELDRNLLGVPTEPYGFSKLPPSKWRAPSFGEVATQVQGPAERMKIEVRLWREY